MCELDFTFEEHVKICESNNDNIYFVFENLLSYALIDFFVAIILKKDHVFLIQFFSFYLKKENKFYKKIVLRFISMKKLPEEMQKFFIEEFIDKINFFDDKKCTENLYDDFYTDKQTNESNQTEKEENQIEQDREINLHLSNSNVCDILNEFDFFSEMFFFTYKLFA